MHTHYGPQISYRKVNEEMFVAPKSNYILRVYGHAKAVLN